MSKGSVLLPLSTSSSSSSSLSSTSSFIPSHSSSRIYYEIHGTPQPSHRRLVFITGWAGSCDNWITQTQFFVEMGYEVCVYENRGSGFSGRPIWGYRMSDMANDARGVLQYLGWTKFHVVGVSMGGLIAQELARMVPHQLYSLCLASTHLGNGLPPIKHVPSLLALFVKVCMGITNIRDHVPKLLYSTEWLNKKTKTENNLLVTNHIKMLEFHSTRIRNRPPQSLRTAISQLLGIMEYRNRGSRLQRLKSMLREQGVPVLVVCGTEDVLVDVKYSVEMGVGMGGRVVIVCGAGHAMNHETCRMFNQVVLRNVCRGIPHPITSTSIDYDTIHDDTKETDKKKGNGWKMSREMMKQVFGGDGTCIPSNMVIDTDSIQYLHESCDTKLLTSGHCDGGKEKEGEVLIEIVPPCDDDTENCVPVLKESHVPVVWTHTPMNDLFKQ